jgi:hypothetical protein
MSDLQDTTTPPNEASTTRHLIWLPAWEIVALFLGDVLTLVLFGIWGQSAHNLLQSSSSPLRAVANTAVPFMLSWLVVGIFIGTYKATSLYPLSRVMWKTVLAGLLAGPLGVVFWALSRGRWPVPIFYVITTGLTTLMLLIWRVLWSRLRRAWWPELP